jgi:WD40 repeat protein
MTRSSSPVLDSRAVARDALTNVGLSPAVKPAGLAALAAAIVVGLVTVMPAGGPDTPKQGAKPEVAVRKTDDGVPLPAGALHRFGNRQARHPDGIFASAVSPDGKYLATMGNTTVIVWDVKTMVAKCVLRGQSIQQYQGDSGARISFFPDSTRLLVVVHPNYRRFVQLNDMDRKTDVARVFNVETGKLELTVKGEMDYGAATWPAAGGKEIAVFSQQAVTYHDAKDGKELRKVACPPGLHGLPIVAPVANRMVMRQNDNNTLVIVDLKTGERVDEMTFDNVHHVSLTPDGKRLAVVDGAGKVHIRDVEAKKELAAFATPAGPGVVGMRFSADKQTLYFIGQHGRIYRWDLKNNKKLQDVGQHSSWTGSGVALSPDESVLYSMGYDHLIRRWDLKTLKEIPLPDGYITQTAVVPLPDRKTMLIADHQGALDQWDLATGKHLKRFQGQKSGGIDCVAVSADGRWFAGGRTLQDVTLWDLHAGKFERLIPLVEKPDPNGSDHVKRVAFNAAGTVLFTGSGKTGITAWEVPTGKKLWNAAGIGPWLAVDPTGRWVAAGGGYNRDQVQWTLLNQATGEVIRKVDVLPVEGPEDALAIHYPPYLSDMTFTPDGTRLVTAHYDGTFRVWDPDAGREVQRVAEGGPGSAGVAVSPDGRWLGVGHSDKRITVWELASGKRLLELTGHDSAVRDVAFTRDGRGIIGNADLAPILWTLEPGAGPKTDGAWNLLDSRDGPTAYQAQWALVKDPAAAVKLLAEKVTPAELALERAQFDKWVTGLDNARFQIREAAERDLTRAGIKVPVGWLRKALADARSDESRARLGRILAEREKPNPEEWRLLRTVQVLELAGTPEAVALLKTWAAVDGSPVTEASRGAISRLTKGQ